LLRNSFKSLLEHGIFLSFLCCPHGAALAFCNSAHAVAEVEMTDFLHSKSSSAFAKVKRINKIVLSPIEIGLSSAPWFSLARMMASAWCSLMESVANVVLPAIGRNDHADAIDL